MTPRPADHPALLPVEAEFDEIVADAVDESIIDRDEDGQLLATNPVYIALTMKVAETGDDRAIVGLAHAARRVAERKAAVAERLRVTMGEYEYMLGGLDRQADYLDEAMRQIVQRQIDRDKRGPKSIVVPGAGSASIRKTGGRWRVDDADKVLAFLRRRGIARSYERVTLRAQDVLNQREDLMRLFGGELIPGLEHTDEGSSFTFKAAGS